MKLEFYDLDSLNEIELKVTVISAIYKGKW